MFRKKGERKKTRHVHEGEGDGGKNTGREKESHHTYLRSKAQSQAGRQDQRVSEWSGCLGTGATHRAPSELRDQRSTWQGSST